MFRYHIVFKVNKSIGDLLIELDSPIKTDEDILEIKSEVSKQINQSGRESKPSEVVLLNWIQLED